MTRCRRRGVLSLLVLALGCARGPAPADPVLGAYDGGTVTQSELEELVRALPPARRRPTEGSLETWRARLLEELAVRDILVGIAESSGLAEEAEMREQLTEIEREVAVETYVQEHSPDPPPPSDPEVAAAFERWRGQFAEPERRQIYHLFQRAAPGAAGEAERELAELRRRVLAGEPFPPLARALSDSETRHRDGLLGWFAPGELDPGLERVVFALPERTVSEPIRTGTGVHLFWVEEIQPATDPTLDELRPQLVERLRRERRRERAESLVRVAPPAGSFAPDDEQLQVLLASGDASAVLLRIGSFELRLEDLRRLLGQAAAGGGPQLPPAEAVELLRIRELLYLQWLDEGGELDAEGRDRVQRLRQAALATETARRRLLERILADRAGLETFYERNRMRYAEPLRLHVERAVVPFGADPNRTMATMEAAREALDRGEATLAELAAELGGRVEELGWKNLAELQREAPGLVQRVSDLAAGRHSTPLRRGDSIELARVVERQEPRPLALARVEQRVAADLLASQGQDLYQSLSRELLAERSWRIVAAEPAPGLASP